MSSPEQTKPRARAAKAGAAAPAVPEKRHDLRVAVTYVIVAAFCGVFSAIYESMSHGVYSGWMVFLFAWPLIGGVLPYAVLVLVGKTRGPLPLPPAPGHWARLSGHATVAVLTVGSCVEGVLYIYGTMSSWMVVYWIAGVVLAVATITLAVVAVVQKRSAIG